MWYYTWVMNWYNLGCHTAFEKLAFGTRQMQRVVDAIRKSGLVPESLKMPFAHSIHPSIAGTGYNSYWKTTKKLSPEILADLHQTPEDLARAHAGRPVKGTYQTLADTRAALTEVGVAPRPRMVPGVGVIGESMDPVEQAYSHLQKRFALMPGADALADSPEALATLRKDLAARLRQLKDPGLAATDRQALSESVRQDTRRFFNAQKAEQERPDIARRLLSGRHHAEDLVHLPGPSELGKDVALLQGMDPTRLAWRGGQALLPGGGPVWFSGVPNVSAGYAKFPGETLLARDLSGVPAAQQGPWTHHLAENTLGKSPEELKELLAKAPYSRLEGIGSHPLYEKVIDAEAASQMPVVARFKPVDRARNLFMRTQGPSLSGIPTSDVPHR